MKRRRGEPGRLKWKMAELLTAAGFPTSPYDVWCQEGCYRSGEAKDAGGARWGAYASHGTRCSEPPDMPGHDHLSCWETMTECARYGIEVDGDRRDGWTIYARESTSE